MLAGVNPVSKAQSTVTFEQVKDWIMVMSSEKVIVCFTIMSVLKENINLTAKHSIRYCEAVKATYNCSSGLV